LILQEIQVPSFKNMISIKSNPMTQCATLAILLQLVGNVESFSSPIFTPAVAIRTPSKTQGVEIELPNFDELFGRISQVSPLARMVLQQKEGGFAAVDESRK